MLLWTLIWLLKQNHSILWFTPLSVLYPTNVLVHSDYCFEETIEVILARSRFLSPPCAMKKGWVSYCTLFTVSAHAWPARAGMLNSPGPHKPYLESRVPWEPDLDLAVAEQAASGNYRRWCDYPSTPCCQHTSPVGCYTMDFGSEPCPVHPAPELAACLLAP